MPTITPIGQDAIRRAQAAAIFAIEPEARAVAFWTGESGSTYTWGQGTVDNRRSRVLGRIERWGIEPPAGDLTIIHRPHEEG